MTSPGFQTQFDFGAGQALANKISAIQHDSNSAFTTMSANIVDAVTGGLAGTTQHAAFAVGDQSDHKWKGTFDFGQQRVANIHAAANVYDGGQNDAQHTIISDVI